MTQNLQHTQRRPVTNENQDDFDYWYCHRCGLPVDFKETESGAYVVDHECQEVKNENDCNK